MRKKQPPFEGKLKIKRGDTVRILSGKDRGQTGTVLRVYAKTGKLVVEGLNLVTKHVKAQPTPSNPNPEGGRITVPAPLLASKVALLNAAGKPTRVRVEVGADGAKIRVAVKGGQPITEPAP